MSSGLPAGRVGGFSCHVLFAASVILGAGSMSCRAQAIPTAVKALSPARLEVYGGYAYFRPSGGTIASQRYDSIQPGAAGSASYYFSRYFGAQIEGAAFPQGGNDSVGTIEAGPVLRYPYGRMSPFVHVLVGGVRQRGPVSQPGYGWGARGGVGLDYVVPGFENRLAIRVAEADFEYTHVSDRAAAQLEAIKAYRLSAGVVLRFGAAAEHREAPLGYSCIALPATIFAGDPVTVTGTTVGASPGKRSIYTWATNGGAITATAETVNLSTAGLAPGAYSITGHIAQGRHPGEVAECTTGYTVQPPQPPTISCSADPVSIAPGGKATITSRAISPQNRPLSFAYAASAGEISGTDAVATLDTGDAPPNPISSQIDVACRAIDDLGQSASATTMVTVVAPVPVVSSAPHRPELCTLDFSHDRRHPVSLDIVAQACLDDVALTLKREPTARLTITGEHTRDEKPGHAAARTLFARRYLTGHKGIAPARIELKTGTLGSRTAEMKLLLPGEPTHENDWTERSRGVPMVGPIQGLRRAPLVTPDVKPIPAAVVPTLAPAVVPSAAPTATPAVTQPAAPAFEEPDGGGFRRSRESPPPLPPADATAKTDAGSRAAEVHRRKRKSGHKAARETRPPAPAAGGIR